MGTTATFNRYVDDPTTWEQELHKRSGQRVRVFGKVDNPDEDEIGGPMFHITFDDGYSSEAFDEELSDWEGK